MTDSLRTTLAPLPPSAKLVYKVLEYEGPLTQKVIVEETFLPTRTVRYALSELAAVDVVDGRTNPFDARQRVYFLDFDVDDDRDSRPAAEDGSDVNSESVVLVE